MSAADRHVFEALGLSRVVIENGRVVSVSPSRLEYCPLFRKFRGLEHINPDAIRKNFEFRINEFGLCTERRKVLSGDYVTFGVSEILSTALENKEIEAAVIAADGCGTAVITDPHLLQGLCGRISGLVETSPLKVVLDAVGRDNVVDPDTVPLDQVKGAELAHSKGFNRFAVTVARPEDAEALRKRYGDDVVLVAVHTSGVDTEGAEKFFANCDFITVCASGPLRHIMRSRDDVLIAGNKVEICGVTEKGKKMVADKLASIGRKPYAGEPLDEPKPLI